jgi:hypothetical protein
MDGDPPKPAPRIFNLRSAGALAAGILLLCIANNDVLVSSDPKHLPEQKALLLSLLQEIGFALIVALIIWAMWEYFSQAETEDQWNARIERVAKSVFFGVFKRNFPQELIQEANLLLLEQNFVRTGCELIYTMFDDSFDRGDGVQQSFVRMETIARFKIKNIGNSTANCPVATSLPNPIHTGMKAKCGVRRVRHRTHEEWTTVPLEDAERNFRAQLDDDKNHQARFELPSLSIAPDQEIEIVWEYVMTKEDEDTEVMLSLFPTDSISITIVDRGPTPRIVRAKSIHRAPLENIGSDQVRGTYSYRLDRYFLPRQGFMVWWKQALEGDRNNGKSATLTPEPTVAASRGG